MPISLEATPKGTILKIKVLESEDPGRDRDRLLKIPNRKPVYIKGLLSHWEIPGDTLSEILERFDESELIINDRAKMLINLMRVGSLGLDELPPYSGELFKSKDGKIPKPHQEKAIRFSFEKKNILLALVQGLGKTLTSLLRMATINENARTLIVCPRGLRDKWQTDIRNILGRDSFVYYDKSKKKKALQIGEVPNHQFVIATYETAKDLIPLNLSFEFIIIDEVHIPGRSSSIYKNLNTLLRANEESYKLALSGTPMRLTLENLYDLCKLIDPSWAGRKSLFMDQFQKVVASKKITKRNRFGQLYSFNVPIKVVTKDHDGLRDKLKSIMYRVTWEGLKDFEDCIDIIPVPMTAKQTLLYKEVLAEVQEELRISLSNPLTKMLRLLQIAEGSHTLFDNCESGKLDYIMDEIKIREGEKACFWFRYLPGAKILHSRLDDKAVISIGETNDSLKKYAKWAFNGVTNTQDETEFFKIKERYNLKFDPGQALYYIGTYSLRSGLGVDLDEANLSYFFSYDYSIASLDQARARIIRLSQKEDCETKFLVSSGTTEPGTLSLILKKLAGVKSVLDGDGNEDVLLTKELINLLHNR